jgi:hypothetical protein
MSGSQSVSRNDAQSVKAEGGTSGLLKWLFEQSDRVKLEEAQSQKRVNELRCEVMRLEELIEIMGVADRGKTARIVVR